MDRSTPDGPQVVPFSDAPRSPFQAHRRVWLPLNLGHPRDTLACSRKPSSIGDESGSQRILDLINKHLAVAQVPEASRKRIPAPSLPHHGFMMGLPAETPSEPGATIRLAEQLLHENPRAAESFNICTPYPGTALFALARKMGLKVPGGSRTGLGSTTAILREARPRSTPGQNGWFRSWISPMMFMGTYSTYKTTSPVVHWFPRLRRPLARCRVRDLDVRFALKTELIKRVRQYGREDQHADGKTDAT